MRRSFPHLGRPLHIGDVILKNRMAVAAMGANLAESDGSCGERLLAYHTRQAQGGAGLIVLGATGVALPVGKVQPWQVSIAEDRHIPGLKILAESCHRYGTKVAAQLHHGGLVAAQDFAADQAVWVPCQPPRTQSDMGDYLLPEELAAYASPGAPTPQLKVMTIDDIRTVVAQFAAAAARAQAAGLDAVEIHAGHGYIISEFLSPAMNQREDAYGGSLENRARLLLEIIAAVRAQVGRGFPVWVKLDSQEFGREGGITLADAMATARLVAAAGVDAIAVSSYHDVSKGALHAESNIPHPVEHMVANARAIKACVDVPILCAGRIEPDAAESHIADGHFDVFSMGRKLLADPDLPNKLLTGRAEEIRPCIYCYCCASQIYLRKPVKCAVNPETAHERERALIATERSRAIAVVGGGPAGMDVARRLAQRGHRVTLLEAGPRLGGTLQIASIPYEPNERLLHWLRRQLAASTVAVRLNTRASVANLRALGAETVVVATGAQRRMPDIPGNEQDFVFSGEEMRALMLGEAHPQLSRKTSALTRALLKGGALTGATARPTLVRLAAHAWLPLGKRIVIIGGELVGLELAEFLAECGRQVTVLETAPRAGKGLFLVRRMRLVAEIKALGVEVITQAADLRILDHAVQYTNTRHQQRRVAADHVIVAQGASGDTTLADELRAAGFDVHTIGDCNGVGYIEGALEAAAELAVRL